MFIIWKHKCGLFVCYSTSTDKKNFSTQMVLLFGCLGLTRPVWTASRSKGRLKKSWGHRDAHLQLLKVTIATHWHIVLHTSLEQRNTLCQENDHWPASCHNVATLQSPMSGRSFLTTRQAIVVNVVKAVLLQNAACANAHGAIAFVTQSLVPQMRHRQAYQTNKQ